MTRPLACCGEATRDPKATCRDVEHGFSRKQPGKRS
jgi:hypothetical protein